MEFRYKGLPLSHFKPLFVLNDEHLASRSMRRVVADKKPGFPCRVTLVDADPGESLLLLNFEHQPAPSPYRSSGPIFVREKAAERYDVVVVPPVLRARRLSLRAYDVADAIVASEVVDGSNVEGALKRLFARADAVYVHAHNAGHGCYACRIERT